MIFGEGNKACPDDTPAKVEMWYCGMIKMDNAIYAKVQNTEHVAK